MRRILLALGVLLGLVASAAAQGGFGNTTGYVVSTCGTVPTAFKAGNPGPFTVDVNGNICGLFTVTPSGTQNVAITSPVTAAGADAVSNTLSGVQDYTRNLTYNGTTWDRQRTVQGADGTGLGITAVSQVPISSSAGAVIPTASASASSSLVLKASAGNFYTGTAVNTTSTAGFCLLINATTAPTTGSAVTPLEFAILPASGQCSLGSSSGIPSRYGTGIVFLVSSNASPFTFTSGTITAAISGKVQ